MKSYKAQILLLLVLFGMCTSSALAENAKECEEGPRTFTFEDRAGRSVGDKLNGVEVVITVDDSIVLRDELGEEKIFGRGEKVYRSAIGADGMVGTTGKNGQGGAGLNIALPKDGSYCRYEVSVGGEKLDCGAVGIGDRGYECGGEQLEYDKARGGVVLRVNRNMPSSIEYAAVGFVALVLLVIGWEQVETMARPLAKLLTKEASKVYDSRVRSKLAIARSILCVIVIGCSGLALWFPGVHGGLFPYQGSALAVAVVIAYIGCLAVIKSMLASTK